MIPSPQATAQARPFVLLTLLLACLLAGAQASAEPQLERTLTLSAAKWTPYYDPDLPRGGVVTEIVRQALERQGYHLQVKWMPWARALSMARKGHYDGVIGAWYTEARTRDFSYSYPFMKNELVLFKRQGEPIHYRSLEDLKHYRIGVTLGSGVHELLQDEFAANLDLVAGAENNLKKLMHKRFDLLADEKEGILHLTRTRYPGWLGALEVLEPPLQVNALHLVISRKVDDHAEIITAVNRSLEAMVNDGTFDALLAEYGFSLDHRELIPLPAASSAVSAPSP